jgi:perosamine synthetase
MQFKIPVSKPSLTEKEHSYVSQALRTGWISSQGPLVKEFEQKFSEFSQAKHGVACSSGTSALTLALRALGIGPGDEVIVPEFTMIASAWAVTYTGATPVFVDCKDDLTIDENLIERKITPKTKAIMPVHIYGRSCNMDKIMEMAYEYNLKIVEDSAEAHGFPLRGDIACFSLFANKIISSGEGGICITNNKDLADQMHHLKAMAFNKEHTFLHKKIGYNFRMTNMQAAVALAQTERIQEILEKRSRIEEKYNSLLSGVEGIKVLPKRNVLWMYDLLAEHRDELIKFLGENGIETRVFFQPMSKQPMYYNPNWKESKAAWYGEKGLYLPTFTDLSDEEIKFICSKISEFYSQKDGI